MSVGKLLMRAVMRGQPYLANGTQFISRNQKFSLSNPYILEALPENMTGQLAILEGKKFSTVCRILDNPNYSTILQRYEALASKNKGFNELELQNLYRKAFPNIKVPASCNTDAMVFLNEVSPEIGTRFDAHGLSKISVKDQLWQLNDLLTKGIDKSRKFYTAPLAGKAGIGAGLGTGGGHAYRDGSFIITAGKDKSLISDGIENVIVNDAYYPIINELRQKFPKINFVKAGDAVQYFTNLARI